MKHYPHHIGDFDKATRHLTRIERSVYRDLIDLYYDTEQRLTLDKAALCRRIIARTNEEATAVEQVLNEFFTETPTGWYHDRCEEEIAAYHANTSQKALAGKASAEARRLKRLQALNGNSTAVEHPLNSVGTGDQRNPTNQSTNQPTTNNQEPEGTFSDNSVGAAGAAHTSTQSPGDAPAKAETSPRATMLPADWQLPKSWGEWALAEFSHWTADDVRLEADKFADHWRAKSGKEARKADWLATWRNWCRSDIAQRAHPMPRVGRAGAPQMTDEQRQAFNASAREEARRLLFGDASPPQDLIENPTLELGHEAS